MDAYFQGYDCVLVEDITATTSPAGGLENVIYNAGNVRVSYRGQFQTKLLEDSPKGLSPIRRTSSTLVVDLFLLFALFNFTIICLPHKVR